MIRQFLQGGRSGDLTTAYPASQIRFWLPVVDPGSTNQVQRLSLVRCRFVSTFGTIVPTGTPGYPGTGLQLVYLIQCQNGQVTAPNVNAGSVSISDRIFMNHVYLRNNDGVDASKENTKIQERKFAPGELTFSRNDAIGIGMTLDTAYDTLQFSLEADYSPL